jgi:ATP-binding cassette subfamily B protein
MTTQQLVPSVPLAATAGFLPEHWQADVGKSLRQGKTF